LEYWRSLGGRRMGSGKRGALAAVSRRVARRGVCRAPRHRAFRRRGLEARASRAYLPGGVARHAGKGLMKALGAALLLMWVTSAGFAQEYRKPAAGELHRRLTPLQYEVTQKGAT